ncbi:12410_t:CDS:1, partial [Acaulospora colombiana]
MDDTPVTTILRGVILSSLMKDRHIARAPEPESFFRRHKYKMMIGGTILGAALGPFALTGGIAALGFGEAGIAAGSTAAWMMSLYGGYVTSGSIVAILQSVGAAGLGLGGIAASSIGGGTITAAIVRFLASNPQNLEELDNFVLITSENGLDTPAKVTFDIRNQLVVDNGVLKLESFLRGFDLALPLIRSRVGLFEFRINADHPEGP